MEQSFKPDKKLFTKVLMMQLTISVFFNHCDVNCSSYNYYGGWRH